MAKLIGISGTHGTGKSTIKQALASRGFKIINTSLARDAQKSLGWDDLSYAKESLESAWKLQFTILTSLICRDVEIIADTSRSSIIVERTPFDLLAYTRLWCSPYESTDSKFQIYFKLLNTCMLMYEHIFIIHSTPKIPFVVDKNRADLSQRDFIEKAISAYASSYSNIVTDITSVTIDDRVNDILSTLNKLHVSS